MIRDILVPMTNSPGDTNAVEAALALGKEFGAHIALIEPVNLPAPTPGAWAFTPETALSQVYAEIRAAAEQRAARLRVRLSKDTASSEVRLAESLFVNPDHAIALHARYADLALMTSAAEDIDLPLIRAYFSSLLLESGRPVLLVPAKYRVQAPIRHAVVAWQPTKEATRSLHDAMPLLMKAASVDVLEVGPPRSDLGDGAQPGADIATHLARHDLKVRIVIHEQHGESVATALRRHCEQSSAQLLVVGGYGHSRFLEWVLGGVTRELLQFAEIPVLFSH